MISKEFHKNRRDAFSEYMESGTAMVFEAGCEKVKKGDDNFRFVVEPNFYYLTGLEIAESVLVCVKKYSKTQFTLFMINTDERMKRWLGRTYDTESIRKESGIEDVCPLEEKDEFIRKIEADPDLEIVDKLDGIHTLRQVKTAEEIKLHKKAAKVTAEAMDLVLRNLKPDMYEYEIEAYFDFVLKKNNARHAFGNIVASGKNACIMHYSAKDKKIKDGDMVLFDVGAECGQYGCDLSRTYPANGKFTDIQKKLYTVVLNGLKAAEKAAVPGVPKNTLQDISKKVMADELVELGMIKKPEEIKKFYFHGSGHYIGLCCHDVGDNTAPLEKDMMFTLEPGLYFDDLKMGIRIEDTLLVTEKGVKVLNDKIPKEIKDIERAMAVAKA